MKKNKGSSTIKTHYGIGIVLLVVMAIGISYFSMQDPHVFDEEEQKNITPDQVIQDLIEGNKRFYSNTPLKRRSLIAKAQIASEGGQFPKAVILACMDSRSIPEIIFDQTIADIFTLRVAGNVVNEDMLASLEYATKHSGAKVIVIMGHTWCGAIEAVCAGKVSDNLVALAYAINPAVAMVQEQNPDEPLDCSDDMVIKNIAMQNVRNMIIRVIEGSKVIKELVDQDKIKIVGALHDLESGVVTFQEAVL